MNDTILLETVRWDDFDAVKTLIQQGVHVNARNRCNQTALYCACERGYTEVAEYLLDNGATANLGAKPLIAAVRNNHYDCVKLLLQHNANINCTNTKRESPMSVALQKHHYSVILLLLQYGAVPPASLSNIAIRLLDHAKVEHVKAIQKLIDEKIINLTSENTFLAAFSFAFKRGSVELAERMLSYDSYSKIEQLYPDAAYYSAKNNWPAILLELFGKGVDINALTNGQTPLYVACQEGHESVVTLLLNNGADPNVPNKLTASKDFLFPLQITVQRGNAVMCEMLLEKSAKLNQPGEPLLPIACSGVAGWKNASEAGEARSVEHMLSIIRLLLQQGENVNAISDVGGDTALYRACVSQQMQVVETLLEAGADVNLTSRRLYPLMAACEAGNVELINLLLKAGADVKCSKSNDETCLHAVINVYSSTKGSQKPADSVSKLDILNTIKSLLDDGVDVNARCSRGETALYRASKAGHENIVRLLSEAGADTSGSPSRRPLSAACEHGYTQIVDQLLQHGADPNASSISSLDRVPLSSRVATASSLPICCAVKKGYTDIVNLLLKHGADHNKQDQSGKSALIYFIEVITSQRCKTSQIQNPLKEGNLNILKSMLLATGDVNKPSGYDGDNALHIASSFGMCDVMMELIQRGANCNRLTSSGKSALDLAYENGHETAVELLLKNGANPDGETASRPTCSKTINRSGHSWWYDSYQSTMPLLCTAAKHGSETTVKKLLNHGSSVNASDEKGNTALHLATSNAVIEMLLNAGANVNVKNNNGETPLSVVCKKQHADANVVEMLLTFGADPNTCFLLHAACKNNDLYTIRLLLAYGADANLMKETMSERLNFGLLGWTTLVKDIQPSPLCIACKNGNVAIVDCLLQNGAEVRFIDSDGNTPLHFAVERLGERANSQEYDPIVTLLLQHKAVVNVVSSRGQTPLYVACTKGLAGVVKQLLDCRADVGLTTTKSNKYPLLIACERKFRDIALMLLDRGADANVSRDYKESLFAKEDKQTPLKLASANGDAVLVKQLLTCGADVNQMQNISNTALHAAIVGYRGVDNKAFVNIVQRLLKSGAEANARNGNGETPLYLACNPSDYKVNVDIVKILLEHGSDPNMYLSDVHSILWLRKDVLPPLSAAASCGNNELVMLLIKFGARLDRSDECGRTALHLLVRYLKSTKSNTATAEILLTAGADVNVMDKKGKTPLYLACKRDKTEFVKFLLSRCASPNIGIEDKYPILVACSRQHCDSVKLLLEYNADVTVHDQYGKTALYRALEHASHDSSNSDKRADLVQLLLDRGADVNVTSEYGESPFYIVCSKGMTSVAKKMLECGAKVDGSSSKKLSLNAACRNKHVSVVQLLLTNGADPNAQEEVEGDEGRHRTRSSHCTFPLHIAAADDNIELIELLLKHGANTNVTDIGGNTALHHALVYCHATSVLDVLLENKADVNAVNSSGETLLYKASSRGLLDVVGKLQVYGGNPNKGSPGKSPLAAACRMQNVELVDLLLKHGADPNLTLTICYPDSNHKFALFVAVDNSNSDVTVSLLNAGANVNAMNDKGRSVVCFAVEKLIDSRYCQSTKEMDKRLSTVRLLLEHGANLNMLMSDGRSPLYLVVSALSEAKRRGVCYRLAVVELLKLMVKHGAMLQDSSSQLGDDICRQSLDCETPSVLVALATFDGKHEFIVNLFRAGAGLQLIAFCCKAVSTGQNMSIRLCQAAVLAGYSPSDEEIQNLRLLSARLNAVLELQLANWLDEDRQQVPCLLRQCRVVIRRQLSVAVHYQTILPAIDKLPLPNELKLYLQFTGPLSEVDLSVNMELQAREMAEEMLAENRQQLLSPYNSGLLAYAFSLFGGYDDYDSDYYYYENSDSDDWW